MNSLKVSIFGMGYVGLTTAVFLARHLPVICVDVDSEKLETLRKGLTPIYEPDLQENLTSLSKNIHFTNEADYAIQETVLSFITVGTPSLQDGSQDLGSLRTVLTQMAESIKPKESHHTIVIKSTTLPGTTEKLVIPLLESTSDKKHGEDFTVLVNPEFTREGQALQDLLKPDKIVIGTKTSTQSSELHQLYREIYQNTVPIITTSYNNAELIKYTQNAFLATKLSFINTIANLCQNFPETDVDIIAEAIGLDPRISSNYFKAGLGYGGSCLPKDLQAFEWLVKQNQVNAEFLTAVQKINEEQPLKAVELAEKTLGSLQGKTVSILGLAFKPGTDDIRQAPSQKIIERLLEIKARVKVYDPQALENTRNIFKNKIVYSSTIEECLDGAECCIIVTEWDEFRSIDENKLMKMNRTLLIDGRHIIDNIPVGVEYYRIGLGPKI